ncbi:hypothetical protein BOX15_Mlig013943g1 [Macrostomum lignano]|uniref:Peptidase M13 C-terminal domain-containing protein n=1 Tax=Macrostomum lignano TaxID=282301 RepID=A0A267GR72_9PLAT|nr:hypothetical protein BOX15_Mlig013943g1 [Macrostomum lignano]
MAELRLTSLKPLVGNIVFLTASLMSLLPPFGAANETATNGTRVCRTLNCWKMSMELQSTLNTSSDPCQDFEEFLCGGFRSKQQFTGQSLVQRIFVNLDYIQRTGSAYSERVTEQLVTGCWDANCTGSGQAGQPNSTRLQAYEQLAVKAFRECALLETTLEDWSFHGMLMANGAEILDEIADRAIKGLNMRQQLRLEQLMPTQSAKSFISPMIVIPGVANAAGRPAILLTSNDNFHGLKVVGPLLRNLPFQAYRMMRLLQLRSRGGSLFGLIRRAQSDLLLWNDPCNRTAERVVADELPVQTVGDAKRLLRRANLTFGFDEFLRLNLQLSGHPPADDLTPLVLPDTKSFLRTVCVLEKCGRRFTELPKLIILNQICVLGAAIFSTPKNAKCLDVLFGKVRSESSSSTVNFEGAFRPLLHGRYARMLKEERLAVEAEIFDIFHRIKTVYASALELQTWIPEPDKAVLKRRLQQTKLNFFTEQVSETALVQHFGEAFDSMPPRGCTILVSPACFLVRALALQNYLIFRTMEETFDQESPHYNAYQKAVILTPAFLEYPHYLSDQPAAVSVGTQALVLAHELTHAVFGSFNQHDDGILNASFGARLQEKHACLRQSLLLRLGFNKTNVKEDFADRIGLSVTIELLAESGIDQQLPGFMERYSPQQLLYIASLRTFCSKSSQEFLHHFMETGSETWSHTPGRLRIRSLISGDDDFFRAFGCPTSQPEVASDECRLW